MYKFSLELTEKKYTAILLIQFHIYLCFKKFICNKFASAYYSHYKSTVFQVSQILVIIKLL